MKTPAISVLLPVYNVEGTIRSAVQSILSQTLADFECIIVDDGSIDATGNIVHDLARTDDRLRVHRTENRGIIAALNTGIEHCSAPLIARMDGDDLCHPRRLELQTAYMEANSEVSVCSSRIAMFPRPEVRGGMWRYQQWLNGMYSHEDIVKNIFVESPFAHPSVVVRRHELLAIGGYREHGWAEDYDLWLRYYLRGGRFAKLSHTVLAWRHSESRLTFADARYSVDNFLRAKAHYLSCQLQGLRRPIYLWGAGKTGSRLLKHLQLAGLEIAAVIDVDPRKIGRVKRGAPVLAQNGLPRPRAVFVITAVGLAGARTLIRRHLSEHGYRELQDFICAA